MSSRDIQESSKKSSTRIRNDSKSIQAALRHTSANAIHIQGQQTQSEMMQRVPPDSDLRCSKLGILGQKTQPRVVGRNLPEQCLRQGPNNNAQPPSQQNRLKRKNKTSSNQNDEEQNLGTQANLTILEETHQSDSSEPHASNDESMPPPKKRGPAICKTMPTVSGKRLKVTFNERGQPIWDESTKLVSFLGATAREFIDINIESWKKVSPEKKNLLWDLTKQKFIISEGAKHRIIKKMGYLWRSSKSRYSKDIELCKTQEEAISKKPKVIKIEWWKNFVKSRMSKAFREKSKKFKELRSKQNLPHTCSRKGYARLEAEMRKESSDPSSITRADVWEMGHTRKNGEPSNSEVAEKMKKLHEIRDTQPDVSSADLKNDAISQVFGDEYRGRVRVYGFGVSPSDVGLISQNQEVILQLGQQVTELTQKVSDMDALKQEMQQHINEKREMQEQLKNMQQLLSQLVQSQATTSNLPDTTTIAPQTPYEGINCKLFRMDKDDVVAEGRWVTNDPKTKVHGRELGNNASKVWVTKAIEPLAKVWRSTNGIEIMEEAEGSTIAWPTDHIIKDGTV